MNLTRHTTVYQTKATKKMPPLGVVVHNTVTQGLVAPHPVGSWHFEIGRAGDVHQYVAVDSAGIDYAWHVRACDEWRPAWMRQRDVRVSEANSCTVGIELVSYAGNTAGVAVPEPYTDAQYVAVRELFEHLEAMYGPLPVVSHGSLQLDRSDPVRFDYARAGLVWKGDGYRYEGNEDVAIIDELSRQVRDLEAEVANLRGLGVERDSQIVDLRAEIAGKDSTIGALRVDVLEPLQARVAEMEVQVREAVALAGAATAQRPTRISLEYPGGSIGYLPEP